MTRAILPIVLLSTWALAGANLATTPQNLEQTLIMQQERVSNDPRDPLAWNDLGNLLVLADRSAEAEEAYRQALDLAPDNLAARFNLALLLQQTRRGKDAETELERLLEIDPRHAWGHYQLGILLAARQERSSALEHYARALAYDPLLSFAENNPHIIDNPLFSEALLLSQRYSEPPGARVPRQYGEPARIVELMLRQQEKAEEGDEERAAEEEGDEEEGDEEEGAAGPRTGGGGSSASFEASPRPDPARPQPGRGAGQARQSKAAPQTGVAVVAPQAPARATPSERPGSTATRRETVGPKTTPPPPVPWSS